LSQAYLGTDAVGRPSLLGDERDERHTGRMEPAQDAIDRLDRARQQARSREVYGPANIEHVQARRFGLRRELTPGPEARSASSPIPLGWGNNRRENAAG
jgi:hypothetical protein